MKNEQQESILEEILKLLEIPISAYDNAEKRYKSMSDWFHRESSLLRQFEPAVYPQGSFRLGTVIRPLLEGEEYDLDLVCRLSIPKQSVTQSKIKLLVGHEIKSYSKAQSFKTDPESKRRCWTQEYQESGSTGFHMDILPAIRDDEMRKAAYVELGVVEDQAKHGLAITDTESEVFEEISEDWPVSNPKGFAKWFETKMNLSGLLKEAQERYREGVKMASTEDVPIFRVKTPLQQSIQLLKRHREIMYREELDMKPISIILTTLAARAYQGEVFLSDALTGILSRMGEYVKDAEPRIANPVNPKEDFADRWKDDDRLESCFWAWLKQAQYDFANLGKLDNPVLIEGLIDERFGTKVESSKIRNFLPIGAASTVAQSVTVSAGASSWSENG